MKKYEIPAQIQAGSAFWKRLLPEQDDGRPETALSFGYQFENNINSLTTAIMGQLPEMHIWAGIVHTNEIIDLTTKYWPEQARRTTNIDWPGHKPPDYLWASVDNFPENASYIPDVADIRMVYDILSWTGTDLREIL